MSSPSSASAASAASAAADWELSKENIQPLRKGRKASTLSAGLRVNDDSTSEAVGAEERELALREQKR